MKSEGRIGVKRYDIPISAVADTIGFYKFRKGQNFLSIPLAYRYKARDLRVAFAVVGQAIVEFDERSRRFRVFPSPSNYHLTDIYVYFYEGIRSRGTIRAVFLVEINNALARRAEISRIDEKDTDDT